MNARVTYTLLGVEGTLYEGSIPDSAVVAGTEATLTFPVTLLLPTPQWRVAIQAVLSLYSTGRFGSQMNCLNICSKANINLAVGVEK